jgi:uncharacterized protein YjbI with pentapeptide repeats
MMARLLATVDVGPGANNFAGADISHENIEGVSWSYMNMTGANLQHVNLRKARLSFVNLSGADLTGVCLDEAVLEHVSLGNAQLQQLSAQGARLENCDLSGAQGLDGQWGRAILRNCNLTRTQLDRSDLTRSLVAHCDGSSLSLRDTILTRANFSGSSLDGVVLDGAQDWFRSRDLISASLRAAVGSDLRRGMIIHAVQTGDLCWSEWHDLLKLHYPDLYPVALEVLGQYAQSGGREALAERWEDPIQKARRERQSNRGVDDSR